MGEKEEETDAIMDARTLRATIPLKEKSLDFGASAFLYIPGPGAYNIAKNPLDGATPITIKPRIPIKTEELTKNIDFYTPPIMKPKPLTIGHRSSLSYFYKTDGPSNEENPKTKKNLKKSSNLIETGRVLTEEEKEHERKREERRIEKEKKKKAKEDAIKEMVQKIEEKKENQRKEKERRMNVFRKTVKIKKDYIPGPGQYTPVEVNTRISTSLSKYRAREPLWEEDCGNPGPGKYNTTKTYGKPSNWTDYLRYIKPQQPVRLLKRQTAQSGKRPVFKPIVL